MAKAKGSSVIDMLNEARAAELTAILQYMAHHYELEDQDFGKLAKEMKAIAIEEMKHAEELAERILFLEGTPIYQPDQQIMKGQEIAAMLLTDQKLEEKAVEMYNHHAKACAEAGDRVSKDIFEELLAQEEEHLDRFRNIRSHIDKLGASYLATLTGSDGD